MCPETDGTNLSACAPDGAKCVRILCRETTMTNANETNPSNTGMPIGDLQHILDVYGANQARWPADRRGRATALLAASPEAAGMLAQAALLDGLLDQVPSVSHERERALAQRVVAAAGARASLAAPPAGKSANIVAFKRPAAQTSAAVHRAAGAALAASLLLGIFVGSSGAGSMSVAYMSDALGLNDEESEMASSVDQLAGSEEVL